MDDDLDILFDTHAIQDRIRELGAQISRDYAGKELIAVCVLKGAAIFASDLVRSITRPVAMDFVHAASYGDARTSSGMVTLKQDLSSDIRGKHVLIVDGIADSGRTLAFLLERFWKREPASIRTAVLLDKAVRRAVPVHIDYRGFDVPDRFVVGYGMDTGEHYRNLPYVAAVKDAAAT